MHVVGFVLLGHSEIWVNFWLANDSIIWLEYLLNEHCTDKVLEALISRSLFKRKLPLYYDPFFFLFMDYCNWNRLVYYASCMSCNRFFQLILKKNLQPKYIINFRSANASGIDMNFLLSVYRLWQTSVTSSLARLLNSFSHVQIISAP